MPALLRSCGPAVILLAIAALGGAPPIGPDDLPRVYKPDQPPTKQELDQREAKKLYAVGLAHQKGDRLLQAIKYLEEAAQLDPEAAPILKALIPLYLAFSRTDDAQAACKKALALNADDYETWHVYAQQLKELGKAKEAIAALTKGVACASLADKLDVQLQMRFELAGLLEESKDWAKASAIFKEVAQTLRDKRDVLLDIGPYTGNMLYAEEAKTLERLGKLCIEAKDFAGAVAAFRDAQTVVETRLKDAPRARQIDYHLAQVYVAQDELQKALPHLDAFLKTQPPSTQAYELLITVMKRLGRERDILPYLKRSADHDKHNLALQLLLAKQYGRMQQRDDAIKLYEKLLTEHVAVEVYQGLFEQFKNEGKMEKALDEFDKALKVVADKENAGGDAGLAAQRARCMLAVLRDDPEMVKAIIAIAANELRGTPRRTRETWRYLAVLAARAKQLPEAENLYRQALRSVNEFTEHEVYSGLLEVLWEQRKFESIVQICKQGLNQTRATTHELFHIQMAQALVQLGKNDEAVQSAEAAVKIARDANRLRIRRIKVDVLRQAERFTDAEKECLAMLKDFTQVGEIRDIRYSLSNVYSTAKKYAEAEEQLRLVLEADPRDATACNDLGYIMADRGKNLDESEKLIRKAIELDRELRQRNSSIRPDDDKDNAAYLDSLGWVLFRKGKLDEARDWLEKAAALPLGAEDPVVWDHLGDVYFRLKQPDRALTVWKKAAQMYEQEKRRRMDDHYKELKHKLKLLESQAKPQ